MIRGFLFFVLMLALNACGTTDIKSKSTAGYNTDTTATTYQDTTAKTTVDDGEIAHYFVVVADTGRDYFTLRDQLTTIEKALSIQIDTMGRYYSREKNKVIIPENDADEMYAGEYYPRRFPSVSSSIEYLYAYTEKVDQETMAAITGIYEQKNSADSACKALRSVIPTAFVLPSDIYIGCMH